jgi:hypothetical protein
MLTIFCTRDLGSIGISIVSPVGAWSQTVEAFADPVTPPGGDIVAPAGAAGVAF